MTAARTIRVLAPTDVMGRRAGAALVDAGLAVGVALVAAAVLAGSDAGATLVALAATLAAWLGLQVATGATPGKHLLGLRVVTAAGDPAGPRRHLIRSLALAVDGFPYVVPLVGWTTASGDLDGQRLGDRWAGTYVVPAAHVGQLPLSIAVPADGSAPFRIAGDARPAGGGAPVLVGAGAATPHGDDVVGFAMVPAGVGEPAVLALPRATDQLVLDPVSGAYRRYEPDTGTWLAFDEEQRTWRPASAPALVPLPPGAPRRPTR